ncbi:MAG TPA: ACT domain-containing protein, partial [Longimicrobiales bacterium]
YYGGKVLHPRTIIPVAGPGIPVRIRSSFEDAVDGGGTLVDGRSTPGSHPVKCISAVRGHALVSVEGKGMAGVPGVAARVFQALAAERISVTMISQSSSEASITLAIPAADALGAETALKREFRTDITQGQVDDVVVRPGIGIIAAVGLGMSHTPGIAGRVMTALGRAGTNVRAIAQGSSELNISVAVEEGDVDGAVRAVHRAFGLHRVDTGDDAPNRLDLILLGSGKIGRALVELVLDRRQHFLGRFGLEARIVALADRSGYLLRPSGIPAGELAEALSAKAAARPLAAFPGGSAAQAPAATFVREALRHRLVRPILVDVSDADDSAPALLEALAAGCDVVTANKKPLAGSYAQFQSLMAAAAEAGALLRSEATVGAGLPIIDTMMMLLATGDRLTGVEGCLSGTLGFVLSQVEDGVAFSTAVARAEELGYTEPDPVADLSGADVARKALILARISGLVQGEVPLKLEGLVDAGLAGLPRGELHRRLQEYDGPIAARAAAARERGAVLRYLARVADGRVEVGLTAVPRDSAPGTLRGTDNLVLFRSERYADRPLVVVGPGAGVSVTAMGVLTDIARIAAERRAV